MSDGETDTHCRCHRPGMWCRAHDRATYGSEKCVFCGSEKPIQGVCAKCDDGIRESVRVLPAEPKPADPLREMARGCYDDNFREPCEDPKLREDNIDRITALLHRAVADEYSYIANNVTPHLAGHAEWKEWLTSMHTAHARKARGEG